MFEHFTFGLPARADSHALLEISPLDRSAVTDGLAPTPIPSCDPHSSMTELSSRLNEQCLERCHEDELSRSYLGSLPSPPFDASFDFDSALILEHNLLLNHISKDTTTGAPAVSSTRAVATVSSSRRPGSIRCRRQQRQLHTQMLCAGTQSKSISALVEDMVAIGEQCSLTTPPATPLSMLSSGPLSPQSWCSSMDLGSSDAEAEDSPASASGSGREQQDEGFFEAWDEDSSAAALRQQARAGVLRSQQRPSGIRKHSGGVVTVRRAWDISQEGVLRLPRVRKKIVSRRA